jgi:hypothetical protein
VELTPEDLRAIESAASKITLVGDRYPEELEKRVRNWDCRWACVLTPSPVGALPGNQENTRGIGLPIGTKVWRKIQDFREKLTVNIAT